MHQLLQYTSGLPFWRAPWLALPAGFAPCGDHRWSQEDPARTVWGFLDVVQPAGATPVCNGTHLDLEHLGCRLSRIASIPPWSIATGARGLGAPSSNGIDIADPGHFRRREGPAQSWDGAFLIQHRRRLAV